MSYLSQVITALEPIFDFISPLAMSAIFLGFISRFIRGRD